ncbi:MAG: hypothetical protein ACLT4V_10010 [Parabacteroides merdae]
MKNIDILKEVVGTQYNDMMGLISIDSKTGGEIFWNLLKNHGIDPSKYFLIGFGLADSTILGVGARDQLTCTVLLLESSKYGSRYEEVEANLKQHESIDVKRISFSVKYTELSEYIKRFDFMAVGEIANNISKMNIIE